MTLKSIRKYAALPALGAAAAGFAMWSNAHYTPLEASSHREAPMIADDPTADNTDLYAFRDPNDASRVVIIANYIPFELPHGGPNYSNFSPGVRYEVHVKNDGSTATDNITYRFTFAQTNMDPSTFFNIRLGAQNLKTTYTCEKSVNGGGFTAIVTGGVVAPNNIGPRSIEGGAGLGAPNYEQLRTNSIAPATGGGGETVFCGPADDPFFADLGAIFDLAGLRPNGGVPDGPNTAPDGLSRKNVHSIALSIPIATLQKNGQPASAATSILDPNYVIGVWASASRQQLRTFDATNGDGQSGTWVQVSRLGMPLTNEVINPIGAKDTWNARSPYAEAAVTDDYLSNPELDLYMADDNPTAPQAPKTVAATYYGEAVPALDALRIQTKSLAGFPGLPANGFDFRNQAAGLSGLAGSSAVAGTALAPVAQGGFGEYLLVPGKPRSVDIKPIFHTGVPNLRPYQLATGKNGDPLAAGKPFVNNFLPLTYPGATNVGGDMLRLNMAVPTTPRNSPDFSNQGLLAAAALGLVDPRFNGNANLEFIPNMDGFPNGRRLEDAVDQIELKAAGGVVLAAIGLWYDDYTPASTSPVTPQLGGVLAFTSGVERNDTTIRAAFPYVQTPWRGTGSASGPTNTLTIPDLTVSTPMPVEAGTYRNITITSGGVASFNGPIQVNGTLTVQDGGVLSTRGVLATNCLPITGPGSFVLQAGGTLRVCNPAGIAASGAAGAIQLAGSRLFSNDAIYEFIGGEAQTTGTGLPTQVRSLTVNNAAGVTVNNGGVAVSQLVTLTSGNLVTSAGNVLTLRSTPTAGTALVVNTAGVVSGPAIMQRAIDPAFNAGAGYRHYSSPMQGPGTFLSDLAANGFAPVFNQAYNSSTDPRNVAPFPNVFGYNESRIATSVATGQSDFDKGFFVPAAGDVFSPLTGYTVNIGSGSLVDLNGTLNTGAVSRSNLTRGASADAGWQFLGNPYPSPINFSQTAGVTRTNVDDAIYTFQSTSQYGGNYRSYVNGVGNPLISAMQGFFTRVSAGQTTGSFGLNDAVRVTTFSTQPSFNRSTGDTRPLVQLQLQGTNLSDDAYVYFEQGASPVFDSFYDAYKLPNTSGLSVGSIAGNDELAINGLPALTGTTTVPLNVRVPAVGSYTFNAASIANFGSGTNVFLLDALTGTRTNLSQNPTYSFRASSTLLPGRFSLFFGLAGPLATRPGTNLTDLVTLFPNPAHRSFTLLVPAEMGSAPVTVKVINQLGQLVSTRTVAMTAAGATSQFEVSGFAPGVYSLHLSSGKTQVVKRVVVQ